MQRVPEWLHEGWWPMHCLHRFLSGDDSPKRGDAGAGGALATTPIHNGRGK